MNNSYKFHPAINTNKAFAYTPPPSIDTSKLTKLPSDWLDQLNKICRQYSGDYQSSLLYQHVNESSTYLSSIKKDLLRQLKLIYYRLTGQLDSQLGRLSDDNRFLLLNRLTEEINACTEGFQNRVNHIVSTLNKPSTLSQLLYQVRKNMIETLALQENNEVHSWNLVSTVASRDGLGIQPNFREDTNQNFSSINAESIRNRLQKKFRQAYTPFYLPFLLEDILRGLMTDLGYKGRKEKGDTYVFDVYEKIACLIKTYLPDTLTSSSDADQTYFIVDKNDAILDVNWFVVRQYLYQALMQADYLKKENLQFNNLFDYACYSQLFSKHNRIVGPELGWINTLFKKGQYGNLVDQLSITQSRFPYYYETLASQYKNFHYLIFSLILSSSLEQETIIIPALKLLARLNWTTLENKNIQKIINTLSKTILSSSLSFHSGNILMTAIKYHPEAAEVMLGFLTQHSDQVTPASLIQFLGQRNRLGKNVLLLAIQHHQKTVKTILFLLAQCSDRLASESLMQFLGQKDKLGYNPLSLAIRRYKEQKETATATEATETIKVILRFLAQHSNQLEPSHLKQCLGSDISQLVQFVLFDYSDLETTLTLINVLNKSLLQSKDIQQLLEGKDSQYENILMSLLITSDQSKMIAEAIFNCLDQHKEVAKPKYILKFLEQKNNHPTNKFILASCCPESMEIILRFMAKHPALLEDASLAFRDFILDYLLQLDVKDPNNREIQGIFIQTYLQRPDSIIKKILTEPEHKKEVYSINSASQLMNFFRTQSATKTKIMVNEKRIAILERAKSTIPKDRDEDATRKTF